MLLVLSICSLALCSATPFHKYPFVFLLDVGNEELGKATTEQIKVSAPGGVIALKYPAVSDGPVIGHIRVTGIDFGTDLKANIVEGGPGYRHVVIVLMGAPGKQYDTVITLQTLEDTQDKISDGYKVQEDYNDSGEELNEESNTMYSKTMSGEITQSDSIAYEENVERQDVNDENDQNSDEDNTNTDISNKNDDTQQSKINIHKSNTNYNLQTDSQQESNEVLDYEQEINKIKENILSNPDRRYVSMIPYNVFAGYGRFKPGFYGDIMAYPRDKSLIDRESDNDYSVNIDSNNNIDDYDSSIDN